MLTETEKHAISEHYRTISRNLPNFRPRAAQREMIAAVANAFSRTKTGSENDVPKREGESIVVIEGPTGVGKSLAYLLAGGIMAQTRGKQLIVSSATIALQEQLVNRDLPFLVEHSGLSLRFAIAKGRGRYLCPYKLYRLTQNSQSDLVGFEALPDVLWDSKPSAADRETLNRLADAFAARRFDGDRDNWSEKIADKIWIQITNDRHSCLKNDCPNRAECPFFLARDTLEDVDVVVANHDLLLSDISMGGGVILPAPEDCFYCIDEAHHLPQKALNRFAAEHSVNQALWALEKLPSTIEKTAAIITQTDLLNFVESAAAALSDSLNEWLFHLNGAAELDLDDSGNNPVWLWEDGKIPEELRLLSENTAVSARALLKHTDKINELLAAQRERDKESADLLGSEWGLYTAWFEQIEAVWSLMTQETEEGGEPLAKWIVRELSEKNDYTFHASPISSATHLAGSLWRRAAGAVLTSATLRSLNSFDMLLRQTGLVWLPETTTLALESPFDFPAQAELYIPPVDISPKETEAHTDAVAQWLPKLVSATEPVGTLVLFTSRKQMHDVALRLPESYQPLLLIQDEQPKAELLRRHYATLEQKQPSIIFGLDSFAEGLDLPGNACVQVIIAKLPFSMPDDPIEKTRSRWIKQCGGNPFMEITMPEASIKLVQAVGRLIRSEQDYGRVTILDNRIVTQRYGQRLLDCLPPFKRIG